MSATAVPPAATISAATVGRRLGVGALALHRAAEVVDDDARAARREQARVGAADAAPRAGDDRDAPVEAVLAQTVLVQAATGASKPEEPAEGAAEDGRALVVGDAGELLSRSAPGCRGTCPRRAGSRCPTRSSTSR